MAQDPDQQQYICYKCKETKIRMLMTKQRATLCKICDAAQTKIKHDAWKLKNSASDWQRPIVAWCPACEDFLDGSCFSLARSNFNGLRAYCKYHEILKGLDLRNKNRRVPLHIELTKEQVYKLIIKPCHYCGVLEDKMGIDRVDNNQGYILNNCVPACWGCNQLKGKMDASKFLEQVAKIYIYRMNQ